MSQKKRDGQARAPKKNCFTILEHEKGKQIVDLLHTYTFNGKGKSLDTHAYRYIRERDQSASLSLSV